MKRLSTRLFNVYFIASCLSGITLISSLSGCASMNSQFDCPIAHGVMCKSLDEVNAMVNDGELGGVSYDDTSDSQRTDASRSRAKAAFRQLDCQAYSTANVFQSKEKESKENRSVERIWLAPYVDDAGNYYSGHIVYHPTQQQGKNQFQQLENSAKRCL